MERFLYRLSVSSYCDRFILKGASLFLVWKGQNYRVTRDADFLGFGNPDIEQLADLFRDICGVEFQDDGMIYLPDALKIAEIREKKGTLLTGCIYWPLICYSKYWIGLPYQCSFLAPFRTILVYIP